MNYGKKLIVESGRKVKLADIDPGFHGHHDSAEHASSEIEEALTELTRLQYRLFAEARHALLVVIQGMDASGKDGVCWHIIKAMNPQGTSVVSFKRPTPEELSHDFLWRVHRHTPSLGHVAVFNRSHYEDVLVVRVHDLVPKAVWSARYEEINEFEQRLQLSGTTIVKFFLFISKDEQLKRFRQRLEDPARQWKISVSDYEERAYWDKYTDAFEDALTRCSTEHAPWYIIPSNHKWFRNLAVAQILRERLAELDPKPPPCSVDLAKIWRDYYKAEG